MFAFCYDCGRLCVGRRRQGDDVYGKVGGGKGKEEDERGKLFASTRFGKNECELPRTVV